MEHYDRATLEAGLDHVLRSPKDGGRVEMIVRRPGIDLRERLDEAVLDPVEGLIGDSWRKRGAKSRDDGSADPRAQITMTNARLIALVAGSLERWELAGDQLYVDLDLGVTNLPPGTRVSIGEAVLEITDKPHRGCRKYSERYGVDALKFLNTDLGHAHALRGLYARVVTGGILRRGDAIWRLPPHAGSASTAEVR